MIFNPDPTNPVLEEISRKNDDSAYSNIFLMIYQSKELHTKTSWSISWQKIKFQNIEIVLCNVNKGTFIIKKLRDTSVVWYG